MNTVLKFIFFSFILAFPLQQLQARVTRVESKEYFANGNLKSYTVTKTKSPRITDLFNYYKQTKVIRTEFDSASGNKVLHTVRITKVGMGGKHCYEYYFKKIIYNINGDRIRFEKSKCDKNYFMYKDYIEGKVSFIHIEKRRRRN